MMIINHILNNNNFFYPKKSLVYHETHLKDKPFPNFNHYHPTISTYTLLRIIYIQWKSLLALQTTK